MLKFFKYLSYVLMGLFFLIILIIFLTPYIIDIEKYKKMAVDRIGNELNRQITIDDISLTVFTGLGVSMKNFEIAENPVFAGEFASLKSFNVKVKLIPLIFKNVEVEKIIFYEPKITLKRDKNNSWNFDDLKKKFSKNSDGKSVHNPGEYSLNAGNMTGNTSTSLLVSRFEIKNGIVEFIDQKVNTTTRIDDINMTLKDVFSDKPFSLKLSATLPGSKKKNLSFESTFEPDKVNQSMLSVKRMKDIVLEVSALDLDHFKPYLNSFVPQISGIGSMNLDLSGNADISPLNSRLSGSLDLDKVAIGKGYDLSPKLDFDLNAEANKIEFKKLAINSNDTKINISGQITEISSNPRMNLDINSESVVALDIIRLLNSFDIELPEECSISGKIKLPGLKIEGLIDNIDISGRIDLKTTKIIYDDFFKKTENQDSSLAFKVNYKPAGINMDSIELKLQDLTLSGNFSIPDLEKLTLSGNFVTNKFNLSEWHQIIPELKRLNTAGNVGGKLNLSGSFDKPIYIGTINLSGLMINPPELTKPVRDIYANIRFSPDAAQINNISGKIDRSDFSGRASIRNFSSPDINFKLDFSKLNISEMLVLLSSPEVDNTQKISRNLLEIDNDPVSYKSGYSLFSSNLFAGPPILNKPGALNPVPPKKEVSKIDDKDAAKTNDSPGSIKIEGDLAIGTGNYETFEFSNLTTHVRFKNNILDLENMLFGLYGGSYKGEMHVDMSEDDPEYRLNCKLQDVQTNDILSSNTSLKNILFSKMFADLSIQGSGFDMDKITKSMSGNGSLKFIEGEFTNFNLINNVTTIANLLGYPKIAKTATKFKKIAGNFTIKNGFFSTPDLSMKSKDFDLKGSGKFGLDTTLDYDCKIVFSKNNSNKMINKTKFAKYLTDNSGRILIPFKMRGTLTKPKFSMDKNYIQNILKKTVKKKAKEKIEEGLKDVLDNLFGK